MAERGLGDWWGPPAFFFLKIGGWDAKYEIWGIFKFLYRKLEVLHFLGNTKRKQKTIVTIMIVTKEVKNFLGPPICVQ